MYYVEYCYVYLASFTDLTHLRASLWNKPYWISDPNNPDAEFAVWQALSQLDIVLDETASNVFMSCCLDNTEKRLLASEHLGISPQLKMIKIIPSPWWEPHFDYDTTEWFERRFIQTHILWDDTNRSRFCGWNKDKKWLDNKACIVDIGVYQWRGRITLDMTALTPFVRDRTLQNLHQRRW